MASEDSRTITWYQRWYHAGLKLWFPNYKLGFPGGLERLESLPVTTR